MIFNSNFRLQLWKECRTALDLIWTLEGGEEAGKFSSKVIFPAYAQMTEMFLLQLFISSFQYRTEKTSTWEDEASGHLEWIQVVFWTVAVYWPKL